MSQIEQILQRAEELFWCRHLYVDPESEHRFYIYDQYHAVRDALNELLPGWEGFQDFLDHFGQLHDEVLSSDHNDVYEQGEDWSPSAPQIGNALHRERQHLQYALAHALGKRIPNFSAEVNRRQESLRTAMHNMDLHFAG